MTNSVGVHEQRRRGLWGTQSRLVAPRRSNTAKILHLPPLFSHFTTQPFKNTNTNTDTNTETNTAKILHLPPLLFPFYNSTEIYWKSIFNLCVVRQIYGWSISPFFAPRLSKKRNRQCSQERKYCASNIYSDLLSNCGVSERTNFTSTATWIVTTFSLTTNEPISRTIIFLRVAVATKIMKNPSCFYHQLIDYQWRSV